MSAARGPNRGSALGSPRALAERVAPAASSLTVVGKSRAPAWEVRLANFPQLLATSSNLGTAAFGEGRPRRMNYDLYRHDRRRALRCSGAERTLPDGAHG